MATRLSRFLVRSRNRLCLVRERSLIPDPPCHNPRFFIGTLPLPEEGHCRSEPPLLSPQPFRHGQQPTRHLLSSQPLVPSLPTDAYARGGGRCFSSEGEVARLDRVQEKATMLGASLPPAVERRAVEIESRHAELCDFVVSQPNAPPEEIGRLNKELSSLESTLVAIRSFREMQKEIRELQEMARDSSGDGELARLAADELEGALEEGKRRERALLQELLPRDEADRRSCIIEVRAGTGGDEASLFAADVFRMYERYSQRMRWRFETMDVTETGTGGYKEASASITGDGVYGRLRHESGVHRVQRVPTTERAGRVHTSTISVAILPQANEVDVKVRNEDLRIDTYRSGGAGGQSVNTTCSAVRVTHIPTGIAVAIQDERSQHQNKAKALQVLRAKLYDMERQRQHSFRAEQRSEQIGSADRSERIRTYNFPQGRVTDHRVGITEHNLDRILEGDGLDVFIDALASRQEILAIASMTSG